MEVAQLPPRFVEVRRLGEGAEGGTWTALDVDAGRRRVVLKHVPAGRSAQVRQAFRVLRRVSSPHLPAALELLHGTDGDAWLVTAWIAGEPLARGPVAPAQALAEAVALAHALRAVHAAGTHHGDVSPGNVLASSQGALVLTDFGQIGCLGCGTPGFLAPEVLGGGGGPAADVFALGCLICFRLFGASPWTEPEALIDALRRGERAVAARLAELAAEAAPPPGLLSVLQKLLALDPSRRLVDLSRVLPRLQALLAACRAGQGGSDMVAEAGPTWWVPTRWPQVGASLAPALSLLVPTPRARLVAIVGPAGSGRGRVVEELVGGLQALEEGPAARLCPADRLGAALGVEAASWIDAWLAAGESGVIGLSEEPPWPGDLADASGDEDPVCRRRAAVLAAAAAMAQATLIVPATPALGLALARVRVEAAARGEAGIELVELRPLELAEIEAVLMEVLDPPDEAAAWARGLLAATGGWPGATLAAVEACAAAGLSRPAGEAIARAARGAGASLDAGRARLVLEAAWAPEGQTAAVETGAHLLAGYLFASGGVPLPWALEAARRTFGARAREMARERLQEIEQEEGPSGHVRRGTLGLALDAERPAAIEGWLAGCADAGAWERDPALPRLVAWVAGGGGLSEAARAKLAAAVLRAGQAAQALALAEGFGPRCALVAARALEQAGRAKEALVRLDALLREDVPWDMEEASLREVRSAALGLRWRALTDLGRAAEAVLEARRIEEERRPGTGQEDMLRAALASPGAGAAEAWLWAALAAIYGEAAGRAEAWIDRAAERLGDPEARPGLAARIEQVRGNLAHVHGQIGAAAAAYERAAAAFERAGEAIGRTLLAANLAALAILSGELGRGVEHGRLALRGYLALGRVQALPELAVNLVQLLVRAGAFAEAIRLEVLLSQTLGGSPGALAQARLTRVRAELVFAERLQRRASDAAVAHVYANAAEELAAAGAGREAAEASLRAAAAARRAGQLARAAELLALPPEDDELRVAAALERALVASAIGAGSELSAALAGLVELPRPADLIARGRLELAWRYDQVLHATLGPSDPRRPALARRAAATWEALMSKIPDLDKPNARAALLAESGERAPLGELLHDVAEAPGDTAPPGEAAVAEPQDRQGREAAALLRIYRRLAREDDLGRMLTQVVDAAMELCDAERGAIALLPTAPKGERVLVARELAGGAGANFSRSVIERVIEQGVPILSVDAITDDRFGQSRSISHLNLRSVLAVPVVHGGALLGALYVDHRLRRGAWGEADLARLEGFAELAALAIAHLRTLAELAARGRELQALLDERELEVRGLREAVRAPERRTVRGMVGGTGAIQAVLRLVDRLADSDVPVVIYGESGTGKELIARAIHEGGPRKSRPFVAENCGAIPETLLEGVLFGHAKGAYTGAQRAAPGLFEAADGGTLFLDEIGEMSPAMQTKLLRVLQEGEVRRVGDTSVRKIDVRVIAASNRDLDAMVAAGQFRKDLLYRIRVVKVELPPLRARTEDLPQLVEHFLGKYDRGRRLVVSAAAVRALVRYAWPGNIRELENEVQRWVALCESRVEPEDLSPAIREPASGGGELAADDLRLKPRLERLEREMIERALKAAGGNQTKAASLLGLSRFGLQKKLRRLESGEAAGDDE